MTARGLYGLGPNHLAAFLSFTLALSAVARQCPRTRKRLTGPMTTASDFGARKIFLMLFLMIGPIKILVPFVDITRGADRAFRRTLARRAILFSAAALALAGVLGRSMLENFEISIAGARSDGRRDSVPRGPANRTSAIGRRTRFHESLPLSRPT